MLRLIYYIYLMKHYIWAILWGVAVVYLCLMPNGSHSVPKLFAGADKLAHCGFFFTFNTLLIFGNIKSRKIKHFSWSIFFVCAFISIILSSFTEFLQWKYFVYRSAELFDLLANFLGIGMSSFCYLLFSSKKPKSFLPESQ